MATKGRIILLLVLNLSCYFFSISCYYSDTDTILQGQQLRGWEQLNSAYNLFTLKIFSFGHSMNRYLGIFYNDPLDRVVREDYPRVDKAVWVANRNTPIPDLSGSLMIDVHGKLKISYGGGSNSIFFSSVPAATNASATLLDSGNFILRELNLDGSIKRVLWQSFDYPTDTLLPGMKLGINFKTGHKWSLTSWLTDKIPASGSYTFGGDPNGTSQLVILWRGNISWTSGQWRNGHFENIPQVSFQNQENDISFNYTSNEDEKYFTYSWNKNRKLYYYTMKSYGEFSGPGKIFGCSQFIPFRPGCVQYGDCRKPDDYFEPTANFMMGGGHILGEGNLNHFDCEKRCRNNCSCTAYAISGNGTGCQIGQRERLYADLSIPPSQLVFVLVPERGNKWWIWLIIGLGSSVILLLLCSSCYLVRRKPGFQMLIGRGIQLIGDLQQVFVKGKIQPNQEMEILLHDSTKYGKGNELRLLSFESISAATNNFSSTNKLGEGGFGPVYKGKLLDGPEVAVKRLSRSSGQGLREFKNEILVIAKVQHTNLVRLVGCCIEGVEKVLVYEYMPNKSLDFFLFDPSKKELLKWTDRSNIIEGIAQGLLYLHKYSRPKVIHRDLKASNILLDDYLNPKISDFGMAKIFGINESSANTNRVVGTYGYMSPEYAIHGIVSMKTDVFSFGVLLLEIVSGKKNNSCHNLEHPLNLVGMAWELWKEGRALELMDPTLQDSCSHNEVMRCIHVGLLCAQDHAVDRPAMSDVVSMLTNENMQLPAPKQPAFFIDRRGKEAAIDRNFGNDSINTQTITVIEAR